MTVIAGLWSFTGEVNAGATCAAMLQALGVYGADDRAHSADHTVAIGRNLLRQLPEDSFDRQPLDANGVTALVADIRIDNRESLADGLGVAHDQLAVMADSELLLAAWLRWREACVDHLCGGFTFAVWEQQKQQLFLARDHTGERPLFYAAHERGFAFASSPKGLHALPFLPPEIDEEYVARYLALANIPVEQSIFRHIRRLPAGCSLRVHGREIKVWRHWRTERLADLRLGSSAAYLDYFRDIFDTAVGARLRTRGGVGAQLSGGLDSGSVAVTAAGLLRAQGRSLTCFTAVPRHEFTVKPSATHFYDEGRPAAEAIALHPHVRHVLVDSSGTSFLDILDHNNNLYDHPCFGPSNEVWSNAIYEQARAAGITVLLNGNCGNSTFSYEGMSAFSVWFRTGQWQTMVRVARQLAKTRKTSLRSIARHALWPSLPFWLRSCTDPHMRGFSLDYSMVHPTVAERLGLKRVVFHELNEPSVDGRTMLRRMLTYGDIGDTTIAAQGGWQLDYRDPTYDRRVVEFCLTVPLEEFLRGGQLRSLARRAMEGRLPPSTLERTQRGSQSADWYLDLGAVRGRMAAEVSHLRTSPLASRLLDLNRMQWLIEHWPTGGFHTGEVKRPWHIALTRGFSVGRFLLQYDPERKNAVP